MKKFAIFAAALAVAFATFAAFDLQPARATAALAPQTVSAGTTNEAALVVAGLKGNGELLVADAGAAGRTSLDLTLWATNRAEGGWTVYATRSITATNAAVHRVTFPGEYLPQYIKVGVGSIGAATDVSAFLFSY